MRTWRPRQPLLALRVVACATLGCASAPPAAEPPRSGEIAGLAPWTTESGGRAQTPDDGRGAAPGTAHGLSSGPETARRHPVEPKNGGCQAIVDGRSVKRSALTQTLDGGLGNWLRGVDVEPKLEHGRFQGWLVRAVHVGDPCWASVDLRAGDIVSRVNRRPIERPEQAQAVWTALRGAGEIVVDLVRGRQPHTLRFPIVEDSD